MNKTTLRLLILAAASVSPVLIASYDAPAQVRDVDNLTLQERSSIPKPDVRYVFTLEEQDSEPGLNEPS